jgi:hypothetical protein
MRESWQAAQPAEQIVAGPVPPKGMHGHRGATRNGAVDMGVRPTTPGAVLDADLGPDRMRVQLDDDEILDEAIVAIGCTGHLVGERTVHEPLGQQRIRPIGVDNIRPLRLGHNVEEVLHVNRTGAVRFGFV